MATRPDPYLKKDPGDIMLAADWNEMQVQSREELQRHAHTGGADAPPIGRAGIAPGAIDGARIDPAADVAVKSLRVNGRAMLDEIDKLLASVGSLGSNKLDKAGNPTLAGNLTVQGNLTVTGILNQGAATTIGGPLTAGATTINGSATVNGGLVANGAGHSLGLQANGGGRLVITNNPNDNRIYLEAFNSAGNGSALEMLLTGASGQPVPQLTLTATNTTISGTLSVSGDIGHGGVMRSHGVIVEDGVPNHLNNDGTFYRWAGQVYINVDDNLYVKDSSRGIRMHFDTTNGIFKTDKLRLGDKWLLSGTGDAQGNDDWLRLLALNNSSYYGGFAAGRLYTAQGSLAGSDRALKHDIRPIDGALDALRRLRGVTFRWNDAPESGAHAGLVAQEVEAVFPAVVATGPEGFKGIEHNGLVALLIEAVKEQQAMIDELRRRLAALPAGGAHGAAA